MFYIARSCTLVTGSNYMQVVSLLGKCTTITVFVAVIVIEQLL